MSPWGGGNARTVQLTAADASGRATVACPVGTPLSGGATVTTSVSGARKPVITRSEPVPNGWLVDAAWPSQATRTDWAITVSVLCATINS